MLVNLEKMLKRAYENKYSVGSFNGYNFETFKGIVNGANRKQQGVIVAFGAKYLSNLSLFEAKAMLEPIAMSTDIPVCLHLDHCSDIDIIEDAIEVGFTSVMYDGSKLTYEENIANTKRVVNMAHENGVSVEAELGSIAAGNNSHEGNVDDKEVYTNPDLARNFVEETGVDCLAVSIGTVHGNYKGEPNIRVDILKKINDAVGIPLVLHGGSGTPEGVIRQCIDQGICKINVNTEISNYVIENSREILNSQPNIHFSVLSKKQIALVEDVVCKYIDIFINK